MALSNLTRVRGAFDSARQLALTRTAANPRKISRQNHPSKHMWPNLVCMYAYCLGLHLLGLRDTYRQREHKRKKEKEGEREGDSVGV